MNTTTGFPQRPLPDGFARREACPLCDASTQRAAVHIDFPDIPVLKCGACGFIYPAWTLTAEGLARYYREEFASDWHRQGQRLNSFVVAAVLARLIDLPRIRSFLDVGTGYGHLLQRLSARAGIECIGVEVSAREAAWGNSHLGVRIVNSTLTDCGLQRERWDVVACFEVIEHVPDPRAFVAELASFCRPGGMVVIGTDNFESAAVRRLGPRFPKWIPHSHISDFSPVTLRRCIESVPGLKVERMLSVTPWETAARSLLSRFQKPRTPGECFRLETERGREMSRTYRFWPLRLALARAWYALANRRDGEGSMMFLAARKS